MHGSRIIQSLKTKILYSNLLTTHETKSQHDLYHRVFRKQAQYSTALYNNFSFSKHNPNRELRILITSFQIPRPDNYGALIQTADWGGLDGSLSTLNEGQLSTLPKQRSEVTRGFW